MSCVVTHTNGLYSGECYCSKYLDQEVKVSGVLRAWFSFLQKAHQGWRKYAPCSWLAYRCILPDCNTELTEAMSRVSYFVAFIFLIRTAAAAFGPWVFLLPAIPCAGDLTRLAIHPKGDGEKMLRIWSDMCQKIHQVWQEYAPFSWLVYRYVLPDANTELTDGMSRVDYFAAFFFFVKTSSAALSPWVLLTPLIPFGADIMRICYNSIGNRC